MKRSLPAHDNAKRGFKKYSFHGNQISLSGLPFELAQSIFQLIFDSLLYDCVKKKPQDIVGDTNNMTYLVKHMLEKVNNFAFVNKQLSHCFNLSEKVFFTSVLHTICYGTSESYSTERVAQIISVGYAHTYLQTHRRICKLLSENNKGNNSTPLTQEDLKDTDPLFTCLQHKKNLLFKTLNDPLCTKLLISHGAKVNAENCFKTTPLIETENVEVARILIESGAQINRMCNRNLDALCNAIISRNVSKVQLLLKYQADINPQTVYWNPKNTTITSPLIFAQGMERTEEIVALLQQYEQEK